jgi:cell division protease FtsH
VMGGYEKACEIITEHRDSLEKMALALLDRETLGASEIKEIINGKIPPVGGDEIKVESEEVTPSAKISQKKSNGDSGGIIGGGLPDPHPA